MPPPFDEHEAALTGGLDRAPRVWRGLLVGLAAGAFYGIQAGVNRSSVLIGLLDGAFWASLFFFLFARPSVWRLSKPPATYKQLSRPERAVVRRADPSVVAAWIAEVQAERVTAERSLAQLLPQQPVSATELREIVEELADIPAVLAAADPELRARVYADLGITLTYRPAADLVTVAAVPSRVRKCVSEGGLNPKVHIPCFG
jgi:hypothetical protein